MQHSDNEQNAKIMNIEAKNERLLKTVLSQ
jgi:hypothetical protein